MLYIGSPEFIHLVTENFYFKQNPPCTIDFLLFLHVFFNQVTVAFHMCLIFNHTFMDMMILCSGLRKLLNVYGCHLNQCTLHSTEMTSF